MPQVEVQHAIQALDAVPCHNALHLGGSFAAVLAALLAGRDDIEVLAGLKAQHMLDMWTPVGMLEASC